jgi:hypothetical protein
MQPTTFQLENALRRAQQLGRRVYVLGDSPHVRGGALTGVVLMDRDELAAAGLAMLSPSPVIGWFEPGAVSVGELKTR